MDYKIVKVENENYSVFDDMIYWRINGIERVMSSKERANADVIKELNNPNLYVFAVETEKKYVGWISLIYMPKVGKFNGHGHIYIDELWVEPSYRNRGYAIELMKYADLVLKEKNAVGIRLYVNEENLNAQKLYTKCGYQNYGSAYLMEK